MGGWSFIGSLCKAKLADIGSSLALQARGFFLALLRKARVESSLASQACFGILALLRKARYWWETFVETKVLPPSPLSKKLWVLLAVWCVVCPARTVNSNSGGKIRSFDPILADDLASRDLLGAVFDTLLEYDYTIRPYSLKPSMLAKMPSHNREFTRYYFTLRDDLFFQDHHALKGLSPSQRKVTSHDVRFSLLRLADSRLHSPLFWLVRNKIKGIDDFHARSRSAVGNFIYDQGIEGFVIVDDLNFVIELQQPDPRFLYRLAIPNAAIVPRKAVESQKYPFKRFPAGSGPFVLKKWIPDYQIVLEKYPGYRKEFFPQAENPSDRSRPLPLADRITISLIRQPMTSYLMFLRGDLDFHALDKDKADIAAPGGRLSPALIDRKISLISFPEFEIRYVGFNFNDPILAKNRDLRAALTAAYDVERRVRFTNNQLIPVSSVVPPDVSSSCRSIIHPFAGKGIDFARNMLASAGFANGIDPSSGKPLTLTFDQSGSGTTHRQYGELAASDFARLGIDLVSQLNNKPRFYEKLRRGNVQLFRLSWIGDYPDAENFFQLFYSKNIGGCNRCNYSNPVFDRLYEKILTMSDSPERDALYRQMAQIINEDCVWILEGIPLSWQLKHHWLQNFRHHDFGFSKWKYITVDPASRKQLKSTFTPLTFRDLQK